MIIFSLLVPSLLPFLFASSSNLLQVILTLISIFFSQEQAILLSLVQGILILIFSLGTLKQIWFSLQAIWKLASLQGIFPLILNVNGFCFLLSFLLLEISLEILALISLEILALISLQLIPPFFLLFFPLIFPFFYFFKFIVYFY